MAGPIRIDDPIEASLTDQQVEDLIVTAVESGTYGSIRYTVPPVGDGPASVRIAASINAGIGVPVEDKYGDGHEGTLHRDGIARATLRWATLKGLSPAEVCEFTQADVIDADAIMQLAAFGEYLYA